MAETFSGVLQEKINSGNYTETQKKQANDVISSTKKDLDKVAISGVTSDELNEFLEILILEGLTTDGIKDITNQLVSQELADPITEATSENNQSPESTTPETTTTPTGNGDESKKDGEKEITVITDPDIYVEQLQRQGWDEVYIFTKMLSLGYMPTIHNQKLSWDIKSNIKSAFSNVGKLALGGPLTNGNLNTGFKNLNDTVNKYLFGVISNEETQLKAQMKELTKNTTEMINPSYTHNLTKPYDDKLIALNNLKRAIQTGSTTDIATASRNYNTVAEKIGGLKGMYEAGDLKKNIKTRVDNSSVKKNTLKRVEERFETRTKNILNNLDTSLNNTNDLIKRYENANGDKTILDNHKADGIKLENDLKLKEAQKNALEIQIGGTKHPSAIPVLETRLNSIEIEIATIKGDIVLNKTNISHYDTIVQNYHNNHTNKTDYENSLKTKSGIEELTSAIKKGDHNDILKVIKKHPIIDPIIKTDKTFLKTDLNAQKNIAVENRMRPEKIRIGKEETVKAIDKESVRLTNEFNTLEKDLNKLHADATKKLAELNDLAVKNPDKVKELRAEVESYVENYNKQVKILETNGVTNLKKLDPDALKLLTTQNKWAKGIAGANGGVDAILHSPVGKLMGGASIVLLGAGLFQGYKSDGGISKEMLNDLKDLTLGMIPIYGGIHDLKIAKSGVDLNGRQLSTAEKAMRYGFGVVGLAPGLGTVCKLLKALDIGEGMVKTAKVVQGVEFGIEAAKLGGKIVGLGGLGYTGYSSLKYMLGSRTPTIKTENL